MAKALTDEYDATRKFNGHVNLFLHQLVDVDTQRIAHCDDHGSCWTLSLGLAYDAKVAIMTRAAQSWTLAHPPPPLYEGLGAPRGYRDFCTSRMCHFKCANPTVIHIRFPWPPVSRT